jgi:hypothetical protein
LGAKEGVMPKEYDGLETLPNNYEDKVKEGYPALTYNKGKGVVGKEYKNFSTLEPVELPEGTKIYRIIDEDAEPGGSYWATELPESKTAWRSDYAVKDSWNGNGYYTEYTVPKGETLKVWRGKTAGQQYKQHKGKSFYLEGGNEQLFIAYKSIKPKRKKRTGWKDAEL